MTETTPQQPRQHMLPIRRPVTTAMIFLTLLVFGWNSYQRLSINLMPDISYPTLTVRTEFEGAAPEDVEKLLTRPLEETLSTVTGMVQITSVSSPGLSEVILEFTWDTDMGMAQQDIRDRLDLFVPPDEVTERPVILRYDPSLDPVMRIAITGESFDGVADPVERERLERQQLTLIRNVAERQIKSDLEGEHGIAQALVKGGREEEITVLVDSDRLKSLNLSLMNVVNALAQQNINLSGGSLREGRTEYLVRTLNEFQRVEEIPETIIPNPGGSPLRLRDIAEVRVGEKDREALVRINGREAVELAIFKWGDANTVEVANKLKDLLGIERDRSLTEKLDAFLKRGMARGAGGMPAGTGAAAMTVQSRLPDFAEMTVISDQSTFITAAIDEVRGSAVQGGILALLVLFLFLREVKSTVIIGVAIPISIIATFIPMYLMDISLNIMSLGGLALGVGMLVDDSIIVLESIFRCREEGDDPIDAADRGTREVFSADAASTFTTISVFLPIAFVEGIAGQLFGDLAMTVTFSLLASLAVALYLIPMLASRRKLETLGGGHAIWLVRAAREERDAGRGRVGALVRAPLRAGKYAREWTAINARETFGAGLGGYRGLRGPKKALAVLLPFHALLLALLFVLQMLLKAATVVIVTTLFFVVTALAAIVWVLSKALGALLWLPLQAFDTGFNAFRDVYTVMIRGTLPLGPAVLLVVGAMAVHTVYLAGGLGQELIPPMKQGEFGIRMVAPPGTRLEETAEQARVVETLAMNMDVIDSVALEVGKEDAQAEQGRSENIAEFTVRLANPGVNTRRQDEIIEALRAEARTRTSNELTFTLPSLFSFKTAVELHLRGDDTAELRRLGREALERLQTVAGLRDLELSIQEGNPEVIIRLDRELLAQHGVTPEQVGDRLRREVQGDVATQFSRAGEKVDIRVRTDRRRMQTLEDLRMLNIVDRTPPVPLQSVAEVRVAEGPSEIRRVDQREVAIISGNVEGRDLGAVSEDIMAHVAEIPIPRDYQFMLGGQNRELQTSYQSLQFALLLAVFLVYVVMACQFESIHQPALVMFSVPLAFVGVIYVLYAFGISISVVVFIGGIVLAGVVVNDAIILVDYINQLRARGLSKRDAIVQAGRVRLRPILITTLTTVLGLIPMAIQTGEGAEIRAPMAITIMAGLTSGTILTLVIIPVVYDLFGGRDRKPEDVA